jgi:hypothetical protein
MNHTHLARCNFMKALHRAAPLEAAHAPLPVESPTVRLMVPLLGPLTRASTPLLMCFPGVSMPCSASTGHPDCSVTAVYRIDPLLTCASSRLGGGGAAPLCFAPTPCKPRTGLGDGAGARQPARGRGGVQGGLRGGRPLHRLAVVRPPRRLRRRPGVASLLCQLRPAPAPTHNLSALLAM